jgi:hypothetical protein
MRRQFLGYLSGDASDDLGVARFAKLAQYLWGSDDEPVEKIGVSMAIEPFRDLVCKTFLRYVMPDCAVLHSKRHTNQNHWNQNYWNRECSTLLNRHLDLVEQT